MKSSSVTRSPLQAAPGDESWLRALTAKHPAAAADTLRAAWELARQAHGGQLRPSGESYRSYVRGVAGILDALNLDADTIAAALLHATLEHTELTPETLRARVGDSVVELVDGVTRMGRIRELQARLPGAEGGSEQARLEGLRKLLLALAQDLRVVLIRLAARLQEMRTLRHLPEARRRHVARETLDIYAPLANRLGIWQVKWELEDLAFRYLEPERYQSIARQLDERRADREAFMGDVVGRLKQALAREGVQAEVTGRPKHIYSIFRKMQRKGVGFHQLFDVRAVRVLTETVKDCYAALGVVHGMWPHIPREFDDYIANPKGNDYRSLHTAVVGPSGKTLEVQIRTHEMHRHAELGVAAHWRYKEGGRHDPTLEVKISWLRQLLEPREDPQEAQDFLDRFKNEVFHDRVYVLSPKGKVLDLPKGATPLDFAYAIHTEIGHRCRGAKVGGNIVPLTYELQNGDQVEILTARHGQPSRDWLNPYLGYLQTARARAKARLWFKQQDIENTLSAGRDIVGKELRRLGVGDINLEKLARRLRFDRVEELLAAAGRGDVGPVQIAGAVREDLLPAPAPAPALRPRAPRHAGMAGGIVIEGVGNLLTQLARCCRPAPPDPITGYITQGRGVTIHRRDCPNALRLGAQDRSRLIDVSWSTSPGATYPVDVEVEAYDRQGLLRDITLLLAEEKVNVVGINLQTERDTRVARMSITVEVPDVGKLSRILSRLNQLPNVIDVRRRE
jgi:GTP pyrophosphokinase